MNRDYFIKLTKVFDDSGDTVVQREFVFKASLIDCIESYPDNQNGVGSFVITIDEIGIQDEFACKETPDEILKLIQEGDYTYSTLMRINTF